MTLRWLLSPTLALALIHAIALWLFASGFLLKRAAFPDANDCEIYNGIPWINGSSLPAQPPCFPAPRFDNVVIVLVDALRFDFLKYEPRYDKPGAPPTPAHINRFTHVNSLLKSHPTSSLLLKFNADPPTTTLQRLKALTTGSLPTIIDVGANFFAEGHTFLEDNLVTQLVGKARRKLLFVGDDTWMGLFPEDFATTRARFQSQGTHPNYDPINPYPSFNVWDLHTVDDGVIDHLTRIFSDSDQDRRIPFDLLLAHPLGVDHAGHRYHPNHPAMTTKLAQWNSVLRNLTGWLDEWTLLVFAGDHGMDYRGDHGGETKEEVEAGLFAYSVGGVRDTHSASALDDRGLDDSLLATISKDAIPQIDFTPTLSYLLRLPIPFANLGLVIPQLLWFTPSGTTVPPAVHLLHVTYRNARQIEKYLATYIAASPSDLPDATVVALRLKMSTASNAMAAFEEAWSKGTIRGDQLRQLYLEAYTSLASYARAVLDECRGAWASFDVPLMVAGVAAAAGAVIGGASVWLATIWNPPSPIARPSWTTAVTGGTTAFLAFRFVFRYMLPSLVGLLPPNSRVEGVLTTRASTLHNMGAAIAAGVTLHLVNAMLSWGSIANIKQVIRGTPVSVSFFFFPVLFHAGSLVSDTFTIHEDTIVQWSLIALLLVHALEAASVVNPTAPDQTHRLMRAPVLASLVAAASVFATGRVRACRPEQLEIFPHCESTALATSTGLGFAVFSCLALIALTVWIVRTSVGGIRGASPLILGLSASILALTVCYWALELLENHNSSAMVWRTPVLEAKISLVRYGWLPCVLAATVSWWVWPVCTGVDITSAESLPAPSSNGARNTFGVSLGGAKTVKLVGAGASAAGAYILAVVSAGSSLIIMQKPATGATMAAIVFCILHLRVVSETYRVRYPSGSTTLVLLAFLHLLSLHSYFSSAHQATLTSADWSAGFIGLREVSYIFSPIFVTLNSVGGPLVASLAPPLLVGPKATPGAVRTALAAYAALSFAPAAVSMAALIYLRRHLMVWSVFAPRWMYAGLLAIVGDLGAMLAGLLWWRAKKGNEEWVDRVKGTGARVERGGKDE
ncbi:hypothetical protein M427DRAFT_130605 [Gonapodya prolifera JEL478]|uniref:GPI ethanolamine phosphate transferase 2 C-terminal domain-containing protein n=1 Tax=Gonapodya prolifera (strain JEL478) TaxID=1344416 RepID=A0A139AYT5_GONPJ|nr:hypothetical protein M427DRAFT_130605 [Gonapodya prolifera JEL478]|eukprot:KXS21922.1 hypothetical protein M427DRAFT_130605 [Gonapodya prolifera JEL478]